MYRYVQLGQGNEEQLQALALLAYGVYADAIGAEQWEVMHSKISDKTNFRSLLNSATTYACLHNDSVVGMVCLVPNGHTNPLFDSEWWHIRMLGVDPAHKGNGIGTRLTQMCIDGAIAGGAKTLALHSSAYMGSAIDIYLKAGFVRERDAGTFFGQPYHIYTMALPG